MATKPRQPALWDAEGRPNWHRGRVRRGLDVTIKALRDTGRLENVDAADVALCRELANLLDAAVRDPDESRYVAATIGGRYLTALIAFRDRVAPADDTDNLDDLLAGVLHAEDGSAD